MKEEAENAMKNYANNRDRGITIENELQEMNEFNELEFGDMMDNNFDALFGDEPCYDP